MDSSEYDYNKKEDKTPKYKLKDIKTRVSKIHVDGVSRTKDAIVIDSVQPLLSASNFEEILIKTHQVYENLMKIGCFKTANAEIDISSNSPQGLEVTFHVTELKRIIAGFHTAVGTNEASVVLTSQSPNIFGKGEKVQVKYNHSSNKNICWHTILQKPLCKHGPFGHISATVFQDEREAPWSSYYNINRGGLLEFLYDRNNLIKHIFQYEAVWREMKCMKYFTPFAIREQSGHSLKSSVRHSAIIDSRDCPLLPHSGSSASTTIELAGLGGNIQFLKMESTVQSNYNLGSNIVIQGSLRGGILQSIGEKLNCSIIDEFLLGGPLNIRGFDMWGIGPEEENFKLGAKVYWAGGLHIYAPLPFIQPEQDFLSNSVRFHLFSNLGNLIQNLDILKQNTYISLLEKLRFSFGLGLVIRLGSIARIEINYCVPFLMQSYDHSISGLQFGVGVDYL